MTDNFTSEQVLAQAELMAYDSVTSRMLRAYAALLSERTAAAGEDVSEAAVRAFQLAELAHGERMERDGLLFDPSLGVEAGLRAAMPHLSLQAAQPAASVAVDAERYRRLIYAAEMAFPVLSVCVDPENEPDHKYGRKHIDDLIDGLDIPTTPTEGVEND